MIRAKRSAGAPLSLASKKKYNGVEVQRRLFNDFHGKCYLCEAVITVGKMEVDHRRPRASFPLLEFNWDNLFPACRSCNGGRPENFPDGSTRQYPTAAPLLDPAVDDVEARLVQRYDLPGNKIRFFAASPADQEAAFTAFELECLHNGRKPRAADLRDAVQKHLIDVLWRLNRYIELRSVMGPVGQELISLEDELRRLVSRDAPFTALVRSVVGNWLTHLFD